MVTPNLLEPGPCVLRFCSRSRSMAGTAIEKNKALSTASPSGRQVGMVVGAPGCHQQVCFPRLFLIGWSIFTVSTGARYCATPLASRAVCLCAPAPRSSWQSLLRITTCEFWLARAGLHCVLPWACVRCDAVGVGTRLKPLIDVTHSCDSTVAQGVCVRERCAAGQGPVSLPGPLAIRRPSRAGG